MAFNADTTNRAASPIVAVADPNVEGVGSGMNAGGCNPGLGIASAEPNPKASDWSRTAIDPQDTGYIGWGGDSVETGQEDADLPPLKVVDYEAGDFNDTFAWQQATSAGDGSAKGQTVAVGYVSASAVKFEIGDWVWCKVVVA